MNVFDSRLINRTPPVASHRCIPGHHSTDTVEDIDTNPLMLLLLSWSKGKYSQHLILGKCVL